MSALQTLTELVHHDDPYRHAPDNLQALQLEAVRERFAQRRKQIRVLEHRAREVGAYFTLKTLPWASSTFRNRGERSSPTFITLPSGGAYTATERVQKFVEMVGTPGDAHWMSHVPQSADQLLKAARLRRAMA